jgi:hypothetical protein
MSCLLVDWATVSKGGFKCGRNTKGISLTTNAGFPAVLIDGLVLKSN